MTKSRIKIQTNRIESREQMETLVGEISTLMAKEQQLTGLMNEEVARVRAKFTDDLNDITIKLAAKSELAKEWAENNPEAFGKARSIGMTHGTIGFRLGNPALKTLKGWTWDRVLEKLQEGGLWLGYIRVSQEVNKEQLLADRDSFSTDDLKKVGVRVHQGSSFYVEPKNEPTESRLKEAA